MHPEKLSRQILAAATAVFSFCYSAVALTMRYQEESTVFGALESSAECTLQNASGETVGPCWTELFLSADSLLMRMRRNGLITA